MVQSGEGLWLPEPRRGIRARRGYFRPYGNGAAVADSRPPARPAIASQDRGGEKGPDRRRTSRALIGRSVALAIIASLAACQASTSDALSLEQSPAGLTQVPLTITSAGKKHRFTVE